jgi:hypothetical protein
VGGASSGAVRLIYRRETVAGVRVLPEVETHTARS